MNARIERVVTPGVIVVDGRRIDLENNVWLVGDDTSALVIDASHDPEAILSGLGGRSVRAIVITHAHGDHINAAVDLAGATGAPVLLHPDDRMLWERLHPHVTPQPLAHGQTLQIADVTLSVLHTPGHTPGSVCLYAQDLGVLFTGDTLFPGGPGATGRPFSSYPAIVTSIRTLLLPLPPATRVLPGHGRETTIGAEAPGIPVIPLS